MARIMRRLYLNPDESIEANEEVRLTQQIINMLENNQLTSNQTERMNTTRIKVERYQTALDKLQIKDQDITLPMQRSTLKQLFFQRVVYLLFLLPLGAPGLILNIPFYGVGTSCQFIMICE
jgi:hypothetical protein